MVDSGNSYTVFAILCNIGFELWIAVLKKSYGHSCISYVNFEFS